MGSGGGTRVAAEDLILWSAVAGPILIRLIRHFISAGTFSLTLAVHAAVHVERFACFLASCLRRNAESLVAAKGWKLRLVLAYIFADKYRSKSAATLALNLWVSATVLVGHEITATDGNVALNGAIDAILLAGTLTRLLGIHGAKVGKKRTAVQIEGQLDGRGWSWRRTLGSGGANDGGIAGVSPRRTGPTATVE